MEKIAGSVLCILDFLLAHVLVTVPRAPLGKLNFLPAVSWLLNILSCPQEPVFNTPRRTCVLHSPVVPSSCTFDLRRTLKYWEATVKTQSPFTLKTTELIWVSVQTQVLYRKTSNFVPIRIVWP